MLFFYNLGISVYQFFLLLLSFFNEKARLWVSGREGLLSHIASTVKLRAGERSVWFHFPSLGEFEQGRPVLEKIRERHPEKKIIITFFSPSGYTIRKNYPLADHVFYLPADTPANVRRFIALIDPELAIFTKYDYWYHFFNELSSRKVPLYVISAIFNKKQPFFRWYGKLHRTMLGFITRIFVQDDESRILLNSIGIHRVTVSGDTRFDRVTANAANIKDLPLIRSFTGEAPVFIAGSTWPGDEAMIVSLVQDYPGWKFILAPHEIAGKRIVEIGALFSKYGAVKYSELDRQPPAVNAGRILIVDNIGMLSSLYQYGSIAYIGGGFGTGIHNTLEAAAFDLPVIFGPNYQRFREARELIAESCGFSFGTAEALKAIMAFLSDPVNRIPAGQRAGNYVRSHTGATEIILREMLGNA